MRLASRGRLEMDYRDWRVRLGGRLSRLHTIGAEVSESRAGGELSLRYRVFKPLRITTRAGLKGVWRPNWPDLYQPQPDGSLAPTNRFSHWDRMVGGRIAAIPIRHHHLVGDYKYTLVDFRQDPRFDALLEPTHLVPSDHERHEASVSWVYFGAGWKLGGGIDGYWRNDFFAFARDRATGKTHAGPGGPPANPLQAQGGVEPFILGELAADSVGLEVDARYGVPINDDVFEGYYSYSGHHPALTVRYSPTSAVELKASGELARHDYGPNSYQPGPQHPPLSSGDRRFTRKWKLALRSEIQLVGAWSVVLDGRLLVKRTNFPDYLPGAFPASRSFDISWNYENWVALLGVTWTLPQGR